MQHTETLFVIAVTALVVSACGKGDAKDQSAQARPAGATGASTSSKSDNGAPGTPGAAGAASGRPQATITLAATDIATVKRDTIEEGIAITGDLRPIETVDVRARLEGDLVGVFVREGQRVSQGQILARFESSEQESGKSSADADRVAAEAELATAQWNFDQTAELYKAGAVAERDYKMAQQAVTSAKAKLAATEARVRATGSMVRDTRVLAPTSGVIQQRLVENGEHVARGATLFTVVRNNVLELAAAVPARQANFVRTGQTVHFTADGRNFDGKVARVSPTVDPSSRSVAVYLQIANASGELKGGTFATGRVISRVVGNALVVPTSAVRQSPDDGKNFVYRVSGKVLDVASVQLGVVDDRNGMAEVLDGLVAGDRVIVGNVGSLGRGMQVIIAGEESRQGRRDNQNGGAAARQ